MKKLVIFLLLLTFVFADYQQILKSSWNYYKKNKIEKTGRPLADTDYDNISNGSYGKDLTFSESVSYVLFRAVLSNDRDTFDNVWIWSLKNLMRKNIYHVFNWEKSRWEPMPEWKKDYLFAWRYTPNIKKTNMGGVIFVPEESMTENGWRNGLDVAPDGDQLIAGALIMAHNKWGSRAGDYNYMGYAKNIINDIWEKCVSSRSPGYIEDFNNPGAMEKWFAFYDKKGRLLKNLEKENNNAFLSIQTQDADWYGVGKYLGKVDMSAFEGVSFFTKDNQGVKLILEDVEGQKITIEKRYPYYDHLQEVVIFFQKNKDTNFRWNAVKNIMFQPDDDYFALDEVRFLGISKTMVEKNYHLFSNDKGDPWINISYYMPFLYHTFAQLDLNHPWQDLFRDALADIQKSKSITLRNQSGEEFKGNGALVPDWCMLDTDNNFIDLPWARDGKVDDYLSSWDAFRTWYFLGLTYALYPNMNVASVMKDKTYDFLTDKLTNEKKLTGGYGIDGRNMTIRGLQYEYPSTYGVYLAYFTALEDKENSEIVLEKLDDMYNIRGYWGNDPKDYYKQNWAWLGLDFYCNKGKDILSLLKVSDYLASDRP
ncbi:MAG: glycosyl hydrolase family 8 [Candidatus Margulisbacteria bacterium]|nr:glycosyl hydrolase family 8 [Candidatus Margulisiibacteriota bacterium]